MKFFVAAITFISFFGIVLFHSIEAYAVESPGTVGMYGEWPSEKTTVESNKITEKSDVPIYSPAEKFEPVKKTLPKLGNGLLIENKMSFFGLMISYTTAIVLCINFILKKIGEYQ